MRDRTRTALLWALVVVPMACGCAVPQRPGRGKVMLRTESGTDRSYYLYLPEAYVANDGQRPDGRRWPVVVSFHGMRPFDDYGAHIRQWQQEADRYGLIVIAPRLGACDLAQPFPIDTVTPVVAEDERAVLAVMDEVFRMTNADPNNVLATSFSSGGYLAHYMLNQHPSRFSCLAVFQSNFSAKILDPRQVPKYRDCRIAILTSENDFSLISKESSEAIAWYRQKGFRNADRQVLAGLGHQRTPEVAAQIFAETAHVQANTPPDTGRYRVVSRTAPPTAVAAGNEPLVVEPRGRRVLPRGGDLGAVVFANTSGPSRRDSLAGGGANGRAGTASGPDYPPRGRRIKIIPIRPGGRSAARSALSTPIQADRGRRTRTPTRRIPLPNPREPDGPIARILVNSKIGIAPHLVSFSAIIPPELREGADYLWMDNNVPIKKGANGMKMFTQPGEHTLSLLIVTRDNQELRASAKVTVLEPLPPRLRAGPDDKRSMTSP